MSSKKIGVTPEFTKDEKQTLHVHCGFLWFWAGNPSIDVLDHAGEQKLVDVSKPKAEWLKHEREFKPVDGKPLLKIHKTHILQRHLVELQNGTTIKMRRDRMFANKKEFDMHFENVVGDGRNVHVTVEAKSRLAWADGTMFIKMNGETRATITHIVVWPYRRWKIEVQPGTDQLLVAAIVVLTMWDRVRIKLPSGGGAGDDAGGDVGGGE